MCSSSCRTQDHASWGECVRSKGLKIAYGQSHNGKDATAQKAADKNLDNYQAARKYGIQPQSTNKHHVDFAVQQSEKTGTAYKAVE